MREKDEDRIIDEYHTDMRQSEREMEEIERRMRQQEEREEGMLALKKRVFLFLDDEAGYQRYGKDAYELDNLYDELSQKFLYAEQECEDQHEMIEAEKRRLHEKEDERTEKYYQQMRRIREEDRIYGD